MFSPNGFTLTELSVSLVLAAMLSAGAFRITSTQVRSGTNSLVQARTKNVSNDALDRLASRLTNIAAIPVADSTVLGNLSPSAPAPSGCNEFTPRGTALPNSLVAYPGLTTLTVPTTIDDLRDPSVLPNNAADSDAIRFVVMAKDSIQIPLYIDSTSHKPHSTSDKPSHPHPTIDVVGGEDLRVGDYLMISDRTQSDFIRITRITLSNNPGQPTQIEHSSSSIWNLPFQHDYGQDGLKSYVRKVEFFDYAYRPGDQSLVFDDHLVDDGFNPTSGSFGSPGRSPHWSVALPGVQSFQLIYEVISDLTTKMVGSTRTPRAGEISDKSSCGFNQLGYPAIKRVRVALTMLPDSHSGASLHSEGHSTVNPFHFDRSSRPENLIAMTLQSDEGMFPQNPQHYTGPH